MPIGRDSFDRGESPDTDESRIVSYLNEHRDTAYTADELWANIFEGDGVANEWFRAAKTIRYVFFHIKLDVMASQGKIRARQVRTSRGTQTFYAAL